MAKDPEEAIRAEIGDHWAQMIDEPYIPAMTRDDEIHNLAPTEDSEMTARDWGIYEAGILRGLELARAAVEESSE